MAQVAQNSYCASTFGRVAYLRSYDRVGEGVA